MPDDTNYVTPSQIGETGSLYDSNTEAPNLKKGASQSRTGPKAPSLLKQYRRLTKVRSNMNCGGESAITNELAKEARDAQSAG